MQRRYSASAETLKQIDVLCTQMVTAVCAPQPLSGVLKAESPGPLSQEWSRHYTASVIMSACRQRFCVCCRAFAEVHQLSPNPCCQEGLNAERAAPQASCHVYLPRAPLRHPIVGLDMILSPVLVHIMWRAWLRYSQIGVQVLQE